MKYDFLVDSYDTERLKVLAYSSLEALLDGESQGAAKAALPGDSIVSGIPVTERPTGRP